jgi:transposase
MNHVAIDLGSKASQVCVRKHDGTLLFEGKHPTVRLHELMKSWEPSRVILETTSEAFRIADQARAAGHEVRVVPATLVRQLGVGERRLKTDERDARKLSEVSCRIDLPSVHVPTERARTLRSILRARDALIETRTRLISHIRGWLRQQLVKVGGGATATFSERARVAAANAKVEFATHIVQVLAVLDALKPQIAAQNLQLQKEAKADPVCRRLMTIPGVGPITAIGFVAAVDNPKRFASCHRVQSYLGLTPGENSSSERQRKTGITKAGPTSLRRTLIQAAWAAWFSRPEEPMVRWAQQISERRGRCIAVVALARKIAGIMFALWRDETEYSSRKARQLVA